MRTEATPPERTALVADIGGTTARFAIADLDRLTVSNRIAFHVAEFPSLQAAVAAYRVHVPQHPPTAAFALAAPLVGERVEMTNAAWAFTRDELRAAAGVANLVLVNDYAALAYSLPHLTPDDLHQIGGGAPMPRQTKAVIGPGTGLGVAALAWSDAGWVPLPTEGGHVTFAAETGEEIAIIDRIGADGPVAAEDLLSGPGIVTLYRVLSEIGGRSVAPLPGAAEITRRALAAEDTVAEDVLRRFAVWLGRFAGDAALGFGARGGIYLAGGIPPKIMPALTDGAMRRAFDNKGRMSGYVRDIPLYAITADDAGLRGAAAALNAATAP